jgi:hypothetical protein
MRVAWLCVGLWGCGGASPTLLLLEPADDATVCGSPLEAMVAVTGFKLEEPPGNPKEAKPGTGHVDVTLNGQDVAMVWDAVREGEAWHTEVVIDEVDDGEYQLKAELSNGDHSAVQPYVGDFIYITVSAEACGS